MANKDEYIASEQIPAEAPLGRSGDMPARECFNKNIRRCDSERELFYDDIVHVQASAYAR